MPGGADFGLVTAMEAPSDKKGERMMQGVQETPFVELKHISKSFPGVKVLEDISILFTAGRFMSCLEKTEQENQRSLK